MGEVGKIGNMTLEERSEFNCASKDQRQGDTYEGEDDEPHRDLENALKPEEAYPAFVIKSDDDGGGEEEGAADEIRAQRGGAGSEVLLDRGGGQSELWQAKDHVGDGRADDPCPSQEG